MKHATAKRFLSLFLALIMVVGIITANMIHAHETVTEDPAVVVRVNGNALDSSDYTVSCDTSAVGETTATVK